MTSMSGQGSCDTLRRIGGADAPVNALRILAHLSISLGMSPVTGQNASVPNRFSATAFTRPPTLSEICVLLSIAFLPHTLALALNLSFHPPPPPGVGAVLLPLLLPPPLVEGVYVRRGGGAGGVDVIMWLVSRYVSVYVYPSMRGCIHLS